MFRSLYNLVVSPLLPAGLHLLALFQDKARRLAAAQARLFPELEAKCPEPPAGTMRILVHVSSVGEYLSVLPLLRVARQRYPEQEWVLSFSSPSLESQLRSGGGTNAAPLPFQLATYLPLDTIPAMRRFLDLVQPALLVFASYDVWPNLLWLARERGIPAVLVNGILSQSSGRFRFPARLFFSELYRALDWVGAVSAEDAERFTRLGLPADRIAVTGNCRFDQTLLRCQAVTDDDPDLARIPRGRWLVAGSTWPADESRLLPAWSAEAKSNASLGMMIAPHEPTEEHLRPLEAALRSAGLSSTRYSRLTPESPVPRVVVVDRVGILYKLYRRGEAAFVGGGFGRGVHNVMEPAGMGLPVLFGPRHHNSAEALLMKRRAGAFSVSTRDELAGMLRRLWRDENFRREAGGRAAAVVQENAGATLRTVEHLQARFPGMFPGGKKGNP